MWLVLCIKSLHEVHELWHQQQPSSAMNWRVLTQHACLPPFCCSQQMAGSSRCSEPRDLLRKAVQQQLAKHHSLHHWLPQGMLTTPCRPLLQSASSSNTRSSSSRTSKTSMKRCWRKSRSRQGSAAVAVMTAAAVLALPVALQRCLSRAGQQRHPQHVLKLRTRSTAALLLLPKAQEPLSCSLRTASTWLAHARYAAVAAAAASAAARMAQHQLHRPTGCMLQGRMQRSRCSLPHQQGLCRHISWAPQALLLLMLMLMPLPGSPRPGWMRHPY